MRMSELFDEYRPEDWQTGQTAECKFCGEEDLHWQDYGSGWRLYDENEKKHVCKRVASVDDFDAL